MENIQTDVSDNGLVTAIRANMCEFFRHLGRSNAAEYFENKDFARWYTPLPHPWFSGALSSNPPKEGDEAFIEEAIHYFDDLNVAVFTWWLEPQLKAADWEPILSEFGFGFSNDTPGMAMDLQELNTSMQTVDGLEVRVAADEESVRIWSHVFTLGYGLPPDWESQVHELWSKLGVDLPIRNYVGYLNGKPVATSCLFIGGGVAGIYSVATLLEARGKGIGTLLTLKPLQEAREMGYRIGALQSSEMGFNVYKRLGFRHLCQIENFYLSLD